MLRGLINSIPITGPGKKLIRELIPLSGTSDYLLRDSINLLRRSSIQEAGRAGEFHNSAAGCVKPAYAEPHAGLKMKRDIRATKTN